MTPSRVIRSAPGLLVGLASLGLAALLRAIPDLAEFYASSLGASFSWWLGRASALTSFALSELLLAGLAIGLIARGLWGLRNLSAKRGSRSAILGAGLLWTLNLAGWIVAAFLWTWGFDYSRAPLEDRWQLPEANPARLAEIAELLVDLTNDYYVELHGRVDAGHMTTIADPAALDAALDGGYATLVVDLELPVSVAWLRAPAKRPRISPLMNRLGLSGFYFPWTGEANVNAELPAIAYAHALAHEKAHQRGFAPEDEANFMAILAGAAANDPTARYAAILFAQRQLLRNLLLLDPDHGRLLLEHRHAGVQRDVDELNRFWERYRGRARQWAHRSNDIYLRAQRVEGGVASYAGSAELLLRFASTAKPFPPRP